MTASAWCITLAALFGIAFCIDSKQTSNIGFGFRSTVEVEHTLDLEADYEQLLVKRVRISAITCNSPASKAELFAGDVIEAIDGRLVANLRAHEYIALDRRWAVGLQSIFLVRDSLGLREVPLLSARIGSDTPC